MDQHEGSGSQPDLLYGAPAIAQFLGLRLRMTYHLIEKGSIPSFKIGKKICSRRSSLSTWLDEQERSSKERG